MVQVFRFGARGRDLVEAAGLLQSPPAQRVGELIEQRDAQLEDHLRLMLSSISSWPTYTPDVKFGGTSLGHQTDSGRYLRLGLLTIVEYRGRITNIGGATGTMTMTLPYPGTMETDPANSYTMPRGIAAMLDRSAGNIYSAVVTANTADGSDVTFRSMASPTIAWSNTTPVTWVAGANAVGDELYCLIAYQAAA